MNIQDRIQALTSLSQWALEIDPTHPLFQKAYHQNPWFLPEFQYQAVHSFFSGLTADDIAQYIHPYSLKDAAITPKKVGLVLAGNIPLVGLHDVISVFLSGNISIIKCSSQDNLWIPFLIEQLHKINPDTASYFKIVDKLESFDAVIATGSNNSARYFEHYFAKVPHIIRKNRNSVAILTGNESEQEIKSLAHDIFLYFGLGCRSVSKIYIPENYSFHRFFPHLSEYDFLLNHTKYKNNFDYHHSIFLLNKSNFYTNNTLLVNESTSLISNIACINFEYYNNLPTLNNHLNLLSDQIQCIVKNHPTAPNEVYFGCSQRPKLTDFADGVDTMQFLSSLNY